MPGGPDEDALLRAVRALRRGDLGVRLDGDGELAREWNAFMDEAGAIGREVVRVAREIGEDGRLGVQVELPFAPAGAWSALVGAIDTLAGTLTLQVRGMSAQALAVARGDVSQRFTMPVRGEIAALRDIVNSMTDMLAAFAADVARSAPHLEAATPAAAAATDDDPARAGLWRALTENVNRSEQIAVASRYKSEFLANMSHELRTPLNSILILARLLADNADGTLTARQVEYARTIHGAGTDLLELINDILDLSKIEAGKMPVELRTVELADLADRLERDFRAVAEDRELGFTVAVAAAAPPTIVTDALRLRQVLKNLLSNAFKFTAQGEVRVTIAPGGAGEVDFAVHDTGIGVAADKQALIFDAFQQADGSTARKYGGTGLGLSISRGFARLLGGELRVDSAPGRGSTFTLSLPAAPAPDTAAPRVTAAPAAAPADPIPALSASPRLERIPALAGRRVLVVDDDARNIFALINLLECQDLRVSYASNGHDALAALSQRPVDLVLMDVMMPDLDGLEVMRRLRADPRHTSLPIVAVTARALPGDRERCLAAGATAYLAKPIDADRLLSTVAALLA